MPGWTSITFCLNMTTPNWPSTHSTFPIPPPSSKLDQFLFITHPQSGCKPVSGLLLLPLSTPATTVFRHPLPYYAPSNTGPLHFLLPLPGKLSILQWLCSHSSFTLPFNLLKEAFPDLSETLLISSHRTINLLVALLTAVHLHLHMELSDKCLCLPRLEAPRAGPYLLHSSIYLRV